MLIKQLRNKNFRFVRVQAKGKKAIGLNWPTINNDSYDSKRLKQWVEQDGNYGVIGGYGNLVIIDIDDMEMLEIIKDVLPETFTVKTTKGFHFYYTCEMNKKIKLINSETHEHYGEIQGIGSMVVGPGSTHPSGLKYKVFKDIEINKLEINILENLLLIMNVVKKEIETKEDLKNYVFDENKVHKLYKLKLKAIKVKEGHHPFHESTSKTNFTVSGELCHCWRHLVSINNVRYLAMKTKLLSCEDVGCSHEDNSCITDYGRITTYAYFQAVKDRLIGKKNPPKKVILYIGKKLKFLPEDFNPFQEIPPMLYEQIIIYLNNQYESFKRGRKIVI